MTTETYPKITTGRTERLPTTPGVRHCGSSLAHGACRFAGKGDAHLLRCDASALMWSDCPYHASGFVNVYDDTVTYRVVNFTTEEIVAELSDLQVAVKFADQLAERGKPLDRWGVVELVTVYEAKLKDDDH